MELKIYGKSKKEIQKGIKDNLKLPSMKMYVKGEILYRTPNFAIVKFSKFRHNSIGALRW